MDTNTTSALQQVLSRSPKQTLDDPSLSPAGVMVLLYAKNGEQCVLLNKRSEFVEEHKGEISFPGGRKDGRDQTLLDTALRETYEEMGIRPQDVEVLGELDEVATLSNYAISPFVGTIPPSYRFKPSEYEVAEVIEIPIAWLRSRENLRDEVRLVEGALIHSLAFAYQGHLVFGATANILKGLLYNLDRVPDLVNREPGLVGWTM